jgi:hypothetical protein
MSCCEQVDAQGVLIWEKIILEILLKALVYPKGLEPLISTFVMLCLDPFGYGYNFAVCEKELLEQVVNERKESLEEITVCLRLKAVVGAEGFEPPCPKTLDLQSSAIPFCHTPNPGIQGHT